MEKLNQYIEENKERFLNELFELIRIPSISSEVEHKPDMYRCAEKWKSLLLAAGADKAEAVSYTHLDVYKRQAWNWPEVIETD